MIAEFRGEYAFLSNFAECEVAFDGGVYHSAEAAFQAAKCEEAEDKRAFEHLAPADAKRLGRRVNLRDGWDAMKDKVMLEILRSKFNLLDMRQKLLETGQEELVEGNTWHDNYWGVCHCSRCAGEKGQNKLGRLLERLRDEMTTN